MRIFLLWFFVFFISLAFASCSIPQIEDAKCTASRETVRSFYAQHIGGGDAMAFHRENVAKKEKFLTPELYKLLQNEFTRQDEFVKAHPDAVPFMNGDPFTASQDYPTGFKVGECKVSGENSVSHNVRLFGKVENKPFEREIKVAAEKRGSDWLISDFIADKNESPNLRGSSLFRLDQGQN